MRRSGVLAITLSLEQAIDVKAGTLTLNDPEFADAAGDSEDSDHEIIELSDKDTDVKRSKSKSKPQTAETVMTKAYQTTEPLAETDHCPCPQNAPATEALSSLMQLFNPTAMCKHDELRMSQNLQLTQLALMAQELRELRGHMETMIDCVNQETRCADRAKNELQLHKALNQSRASRRHQASPSESKSDDYDTSPSACRFCACCMRSQHGSSSQDIRQQYREDNSRRMSTIHRYENSPI
ncbi:hypothetical protein H0H81_000453 [Sphagnurus paluster]|uniref:Uncharacterized protein n=1 Tax=Sphagnurus paluster TaxID=117069 RepID=A0A9P7FMU5_9AGAR|nr:hypothetical protein H0H81_000453 [Sphagnurus paluster]